MATVPKKKSTKTSTPVKRKPARRKRRLSVNWREVKAWILLILIGLVLYFLARPSVEEIIGNTIDRGARVPAGTWQYGIDISHHNDSGIQWDSLFVMTDAHRHTVRHLEEARDVQPIRFVFIKATEGVTFRDRRFKENWTEAGKRSLSRGAYHFYRTSKDPVEQARHFIRVVGSLKYRDLPPVLDIETLHGGISRQKLNADLKTWLETVGKHYGKTPIVYTYESFARDYLDRSITDKYPIWIAHYGVSSPDREDWDYWQFSDEGVVHGIPGYVDLNVMR